MYRPSTSALPSSIPEPSSLSASRTVPRPFTVFLMPRPWATSWNMVSAKKASKVTCLRCSGAMSSAAIGSMIASNFARMAFLSCSRRVPLASCTCSSFGRLMAIVFEPALQSPA